MEDRVTQHALAGSPDGMPNDRFAIGEDRQIAKIVSNAAGYGDTPTGQLFQDVPPGHVFYPWVQRLASRGYISGYSCGGPGEPCAPPDNRAYFRPGNNATRGQVSKIVAGTFSPSCARPPRERSASASLKSWR
jgi:hypothetical protein